MNNKKLKVAASPALVAHTETGGPAHAYDATRLPFVFLLRKEVFTPNERLDNPLSLELIFQQVIADVLAPKRHVRISEAEQKDMHAFLNERGIVAGSKTANKDDKLTVIERARKWSDYFTRHYPVRLAGPTEANTTHALAVGDTCVSLIRQTKKLIAQTGEWAINTAHDFKVAYSDINFESWKPGNNKLVATVQGKLYTLLSRSVNNILGSIESYLIACEADAKFVLSTKQYQVRDATLLSFPANVVIALGTKKDIDAGWYYGSYGGKTGAFPADYVVPIVGAPTEQAVDQARRAEIRRMTSSGSLKRPLLAPGRSQTQLSPLSEGASIKSSMGTGAVATAAAGTTTLVAGSGRTRVALPDEEILSQGKYSMMQFAKEHFRLGQEKYEMQRNLDGSIRGTIRKLNTAPKTKKKKGKEANLAWSWSELAELVKFSKSPIQASLLLMDDSQTGLNKLALECFIAIMKFMGDYMAKGKTEIDIVHFLLLASQKHLELRDEIYCQMIKQTTNNKSERADSAARGWRLLLILTAFIQPSDTLERYLRAYLQNTAFNKDREFQDQAIICLRNLRHTLKFGGRKIFPDSAEMHAVLAGKYTKIQKLFLPGDRTKSIKIHAVTSVLDVVRQMCEKMEVSAFSEYGIYICTQTSEHGTLLQGCDYILDTTTILEKKALPYRLYFRKVMWFTPEKFDNSLYASMLFDQILNTFKHGYLLQASKLTQEYLTGEFAELIALQHIAVSPQPSVDELFEQFRGYMPATIFGKMMEQEWSRALSAKYMEVSGLYTATSAKVRFLTILSSYELFGYRFFLLDSISDPRVPGQAFLAIGRSGISFLDVRTKEKILSYSFNEIVSTRRLGSRATGKHFVDLKLGNLMVQRVTRCETRQGTEVTAIIASYITAYVDEHRIKGGGK